jgi:Fe-S oxidoreductase
VFERITPEEIWACTTCKACDENCPVNIEILDKILDMRRYLSLMESNFPAELGNAYRAMENQGNPWGMNQGERADWAKGLDDVTVLDPGEPITAEYLYWVGCAGSFDDKNKKVTQAMAKLLKRAGIEVAILGPSEMCTGDITNIDVVTDTCAIWCWVIGTEDCWRFTFIELAKNDRN